MANEERRIYWADLRRTPWRGRRFLCAPGVKAWAARYGFDVQRFLREGVPVDDLLATGDPIAKRIVEAKYGPVRRR